MQLINSAEEVMGQWNNFSELVGIAEQEKEKTGKDYKIMRNGVCLYDTNDDPSLKNYLQFSTDEWNNKETAKDEPFEHESSSKPSIYFDIDGTLGYWYTDGRGLSYPEEILDPANHYFKTIEEHPFMIELARNMQEQGYDVCIISAADRDTIRDKWEWIDTSLPFVEKENICFCPIGADKTGFVKGNAEISILVDDYPKNLDEWTGTSVKAINSVNSHQNKYYEIDGITAENDFSKWDDLMMEAEGTIRKLLDIEKEKELDEKPFVLFEDDFVVSISDDSLTCVGSVYLPTETDWKFDAYVAFEWNKDGQIKIQDTYKTDDSEYDYRSQKEDIVNAITESIEKHELDFETEKENFKETLHKGTLEEFLDEYEVDEDEFEAFKEKLKEEIKCTIEAPMGVDDVIQKIEGNYKEEPETDDKTSRNEEER